MNAAPRRGVRATLLSCLAALAACGDEPDDLPADAPPGTFDDRPVVRASEPPPPIWGGTLAVLQGGTTVIASDPARDLVAIVDIERHRVVHTIALAPGDAPWRIAEDGDGRVHVVLRGAGSLLTLDPTAGTVLARRAACRHARGAGYDAATDTVVVACAEGAIATLAAGPTDDGAWPDASVQYGLPTDLRDIVVADHGVIATRMRAASHEPIAVAADSAPPLAGPPTLDASTPFSIPQQLHASVAWRARAVGDDRFLVLHQYATDRPIDLTAAPDDSDDGAGSEDGGDDGHGAYGNPSDGRPTCGPVVTSAVTLVDASGDAHTSGPLADVVLAVDVALAPDDDLIAIAVAGNADVDPTRRDEASSGVALTTVRALDTTRMVGPCTPVRGVDEITDAIVAVAFLPDGRLLSQAADPPRLHITEIHDDAEPTWTLELPGASIADTGHALFHADAGEGLACASCHPEGGDDGRVWRFSGVGPRRTQPLDVGLAGTAPFHWAGDLPQFDALLDDVHQRRMGARPLSDARREAFSAWVLGLPPSPAARAGGDAAAQRGAALFAAYGCTSCHAGARPVDGRSVELGGATLQIPVLAGVGLRTPLMHDGRAETLREAAWDMLARTRPEAPPLAAQALDDLVAYLQTL